MSRRVSTDIRPFVTDYCDLFGLECIKVLNQIVGRRKGQRDVDQNGEEGEEEDGFDEFAGRCLSGGGMVGGGREEGW